jgi:hypothetical protein
MAARKLTSASVFAVLYDGSLPAAVFEVYDAAFSSCARLSRPQEFKSVLTFPVSIGAFSATLLFATNFA